MIQAGLSTLPKIQPAPRLNQGQRHAHTRTRSRFDLHGDLESDISAAHFASSSFSSCSPDSQTFVDTNNVDMPQTLRPGSPIRGFPTQGSYGSSTQGSSTQGSPVHGSHNHGLPIKRSPRLHSPAKSSTYQYQSHSHSPGKDITNNLPRYSPKIALDKPLPDPPRLSSSKSCLVCHEGFQSGEKIAQLGPGIVHFDCFRCSECNNHLEYSQYYFSKEYQRIYCHVDYHETFSDRCSYCQTPIESNGIFALDKHWHSGHFFCSECSKPFSQDEDYVVLENLPVCQDCYTDKSTPVCWKCSYKCSNASRAIEALGRTWCSTCFSCEECHTSFNTNEFILRENGTLVCEPCEAARIKNAIWGDLH